MDPRANKLWRDYMVARDSLRRAVEAHKNAVKVLENANEVFKITQNAYRSYLQNKSDNRSPV